MARNLRLIRVSDDSDGSCSPKKRSTGLHTQASVVIRLTQKNIMPPLETTADSVAHEGGCSADYRLRPNLRSLCCLSPWKTQYRTPTLCTQVARGERTYLQRYYY